MPRGRTVGGVAVRASPIRFEFDHRSDHTCAMSPIERVTEHETRRRREGLLISVRSPHPETLDLADTGLRDWVADLAGDEGLVDVAGGTAVHWVEGRGWVTESA